MPYGSKDRVRPAEPLRERRPLRLRRHARHFLDHPIRLVLGLPVRAAEGDLTPWVLPRTRAPDALLDNLRVAPPGLPEALPELPQSQSTARESGPSARPTVAR